MSRGYPERSRAGKEQGFVQPSQSSYKISTVIQLVEFSVVWLLNFYIFWKGEGPIFAILKHLTNSDFLSLSDGWAVLLVVWFLLLVCEFVCSCLRSPKVSVAVVLCIYVFVYEELFCVFLCSCMRSLKVNLEFLPQSSSTLLFGTVSLTKPDRLANEYQGSSWRSTSPGAAGPHMVTCELRGEWESELRSSHSPKKHCMDRAVSSALGICPNKVLSNCSCPHQPPAPKP